MNTVLNENNLKALGVGELPILLLRALGFEGKTIADLEWHGELAGFMGQLLPYLPEYNPNEVNHVLTTPYSKESYNGCGFLVQEEGLHESIYVRRQDNAAIYAVRDGVVHIENTVADGKMIVEHHPIDGIREYHRIDHYDMATGEHVYAEVNGRVIASIGYENGLRAVRDRDTITTYDVETKLPVMERDISKNGYDFVIDWKTGTNQGIAVFKDGDNVVKRTYDVVTDSNVDRLCEIAQYPDEYKKDILYFERRETFDKNDKLLSYSVRAYDLNGDCIYMNNFKHSRYIRIRNPLGYTEEVVNSGSMRNSLCRQYVGKRLKNIYDTDIETRIKDPEGGLQTGDTVMNSIAMVRDGVYMFRHFNQVVFSIRCKEDSM